MNVSILEDLWLSARGIRFHQAFLARSQYWEAERLQHYQLLHARRLLSAAGREVPYYRQLFRELDFHPEHDLASLETLRLLPTMSKQKARELGERLLAPRAQRSAMELRSSGSTGEPFVVQVSKGHWVVEQGIVWRHWSWLGYRFRDRMAIVRSYVPKAGEPLWKLDPARNFLYFSAYHLTPDNAATYLQKLREWQPRFLRGYPASLYLLAKMAESEGLEVPAVRGILTASETLLPVYRETIERVFGGKVFDWFGQSEETITMNECEAHEGLHINQEYGICELIPDPSLASNERRIVATCLHNYAMPLIRYETGDIAIIDEAGQRCSCGRTLPLVKAIKGRSDDFIYTPDGRVVPSVNFYTLFYEFTNIIAFQLVQREVGRLDVYLKAHDFSREHRESLERKLKERLGEAIQIQIDENRDFIQAAEGKKRVVVSSVRGAYAV